MLFQVLVEVTLFREYRFAFYQLLGVVLLKNRGDNFVVFFGVGSPMHIDAIGYGIFFELLQVAGEIGKYTVFDA